MVDEDEELILKPMNCPSHMTPFNTPDALATK
jgi:threonyl-tRNA synthetase